jgi:hypothetical protein
MPGFEDGRGILDIALEYLLEVNNHYSRSSFI